MKCPHCSEGIPDDSRFCPECGRRVAEEKTAQAVMSTGPVLTIGGNETLDNNQTRQNRRVSREDLLGEGDEFAGRYEIKSVLGAGGAGVVYAARDKVTSEEVALKLIRPDRLQGTDAMQRLIKEGVTSRGIRHPNVIAVYDVGESDGQPYMSMELARGESLRSWNQKRLAARRDCSLKTAVCIISSMLDGLEAAHDKGVVHRDLKPENVILTADPTDNGAPLKILDFGIAIAVGASSGVSGSGPAGSIGYMAPEQMTAPDTVGPAADLYSISVIFYELLMDAPPQGHWQPPSGGRSGIPAGIDQLIEKSLSNRARSRPQSIAEYRKMLKAALGPMGLVDWSTIYKPRRAGSFGSFDWKKVPQWAWWAGGAILGIAIVAWAVDEYNTASDPGYFDEYGAAAPVSSGVATVPQQQAVATLPSSQAGLSRLSGTWDDGSGSLWRVAVANNGQVQGQAMSGPSQGWSMVGAFTGNQISWQAAMNGYGASVQGNGEFDGGCHITYQAYDTSSGYTSSGQLHINHPAGAPCP